MERKITITGHRGASGRAPENTLESIKAAWEDGADAVEIDVQETADGQLVLLHDDDFDRTTDGSGNLWELEYGEIAEFDAGSWFASEYSGAGVPLLSSVLDNYKSRLGFNIELKVNGHQKKLWQKTMALLEEKEMLSNCIITSSDYAMIDSVKSAYPDQRVGYIIEEIPERGFPFTAEIDLFSVDYSLISREFVTKAEKFGKEVHAWTVNSPFELELLIAAGVKNIITDFPGRMRKFLLAKINRNNR